MPHDTRHRLTSCTPASFPGKSAPATTRPTPSSPKIASPPATTALMNDNVQMNCRMKQILMILSLCLLGGCSKKEAASEITADDVAWATDWKIFKKPLSSISCEPVYSVGFVVLGEEGQVISEGPWCGGGEGPPLAGDSIISAAIKRSGDH